VQTLWSLDGEKAETRSKMQRHVIITSPGSPGEPFRPRLAVVAIPDLTDPRQIVKASDDRQTGNLHCACVGSHAACPNLTVDGVRVAYTPFS
jgi:hypothetical protein